MHIELKRLDDAFLFEAQDESGNTMRFDGSPKIGGQGKGVSPMQSLLMALGGCSAFDIVIILKKQKQQITGFEISIDGEREKDKEPALWQTAHIHFKLKGNIEKDKAVRAAQLSM